MKEIKTNNFQEKQADLVTSPPIAGEEEGTKLPTKKMKYIYQLNKWVLDTDGDE